jgi:hypothetical protein
MFSNHNKIIENEDHDGNIARIDSFPNLTAETSPDFAKLKTYAVYLIIIATFSFAIAAYIKERDNSSTINEAVELERISNDIFLGDKWDDRKINLFLYHWGNLDKSQRQALKQQRWFQQFSSSLTDHVSKNMTNSDSNSFTPEKNDDLLRTLAIVIEARHANRILAAAPNAKKSTGEVTNKRNPVQDRKYQPQIATSTISHEPKNTADNEEEFVAPSPPSVKHPLTAEDKGQTPVREQLTTAKSTQSLTTSTEKLKTDTLQQQISARPDTKAGNTSALTASEQAPPALAKVTNATKNKITPAKDKSAFNGRPTPAELNSMISQYVDAYEKGNVNKILELLSFNARINSDRNSIEIQQSLKDRFATTTDRQLFIRNIKWKYENNIAKGIGDIETLTLPKDKSGVIATSGKIQIIAKKLNNTVLMTHLYTSEHQK